MVSGATATLCFIGYRPTMANGDLELEQGIRTAAVG
jgi:hypothetical protein